jgi:hypothetical protein
MTVSRAITYLFWCGEKIATGTPLTEAELTEMFKARGVMMPLCKSIFRVKDQDFAYTEGQPFN